MKTRIYFLDNLRTLMILLVVVLHAGMTYEQGFDSFWIVSDPAKFDPIALVRMYLDLFVMFIIFFISGYFVPRSIKDKSARDFLKLKFKRIMIPWLIAVFTLIPAYKAIFLFSRGMPQEAWYSYFHLFQRTGTDLAFFANNPTQNWLWFLPVLFLFQVVYLSLAKLNLLSFRISLKQAVILTFVLGVVYSMVISITGLKGWSHSPLLDFQRERLLIYFMSFLLGALCYKLNVFESDRKNIKLYIFSNVVLTISLGVFTAVALNLFFNLIEPERNFFFISDFFDRVVYYASALLSMLSSLHVFIHAFRFSFNKTNRIMNELNKNSYSVYIIHMIVLGVVALAMINLPIHGGIKYILLTSLTFTLSNMLIYSWRKSRQRTFNFQTVVPVLIAVFFIGTAFQQKPNDLSDSNEQKELTEKQTPQETESLHAACVFGDLVTVKKYIASGADLNIREPEGGSSPLIVATLFGHTDIALALIEAGADVNLTNNDGSTALHTAAFFCRTEIVEALLKNGANKFIKNNADSTPAESVAAPFETVKGIYEYFIKIYEPLGLKLDLERIKNTRPVIAEMLQ
jgi:peptidoglycan/LPS O-acetylase OafA/YrhL